MIKRIVAMSLAILSLTTVLVGCGKQEDTPIVIDEENTVITIDNPKVEKLPADKNENLVVEKLPATKDDENEMEELTEEELMYRLRVMRMNRLQTHIPPISGYRIKRWPRIPVRPVVPVPIINPRLDFDEFKDILKDIIIKPPIIRPVLPTYPRLSGSIMA